MKIKRLEIKNWLGLSEFAIDPGKINFLTGRKGSGKSSVIEALEKVFTNKNNLQLRSKLFATARQNRPYLLRLIQALKWIGECELTRLII